MERIEFLMESLWEIPHLPVIWNQEDIKSHVEQINPLEIQKQEKITIFKDPITKRKQEKSIESTETTDIPLSKDLSSFEMQKLMHKIWIEDSRGKERLNHFSGKLKNILPKSLLKKEKMPLPIRIGRAKAQREREKKEISLKKETGMFIKKKKKSKRH